MAVNGGMRQRGSVQTATGKTGNCLSQFAHRLSRKKTLDSNVMSTPLKRCLTTFDITLLGVGHMIGAGIYVLTGAVAKSIAGPGILVSYIIAGITSFLAALCYAEFGARVPKAGSAYVYTYVTIGELLAFVIGWDVVLEHMIGSASVARAWSGYLDSLLGGVIANGTREYIGEMNVPYIADYPDFLAFGICFSISIVLSVGVKGSSIFNTLFTLINLSVITFVICVGFYYARGTNWVSVPGGFMPFGFNGVIAGAAKCFYAYVGFDSIATSSEEAKTPSRSIPLATFLAMVIATVAYVTMSTALTLMVPYNTILPASAFPDAFMKNGAEWARYIVSVGALAGMTTTMFGGLFALPRCIYAMATDGLIFQCFSYVNKTTQTPIITLVTCSFLTALIALLFDIEKLVDFMSIGTLMAYTIVSASVTILRYQPALKDDPYVDEASPTFDSSNNFKAMDNGGRLKAGYSFPFLEAYRPGMIPTLLTLAMIASIVGLCLTIQFGGPLIMEASWWPILLIILFLIGIFLSLAALHLYDQSCHHLKFTVPLVPLLPALSIFCNVFLLTHLDLEAWIRFAVWMGIGFLIYFGYGIWHSKENDRFSVSTAKLVHHETTIPTAPPDEKSNIQMTETTNGHDGTTKL